MLFFIQQIGQLCICELYYGYIVAMVRSMLNSRFMLSKFLLTAARLKEIKEDFNAQPLKIVSKQSVESFRLELATDMFFKLDPI